MPFTAADEKFLRGAIAFAKIAFAEREVPVGAVVVREGHMIGRGRNRREALGDPTHHASGLVVARNTFISAGGAALVNAEPSQTMPGAVVFQSNRYRPVSGFTVNWGGTTWRSLAEWVAATGEES